MERSFTSKLFEICVKPRDREILTFGKLEVNLRRQSADKSILFSVKPQHGCCERHGGTTIKNDMDDDITKGTFFRLEFRKEERPVAIS